MLEFLDLPRVLTTQRQSFWLNYVKNGSKSYIATLVTWKWYLSTSRIYSNFRTNTVQKGWKYGQSSILNE